eukprot:scaffold6.g2885.t1
MPHRTRAALPPPPAPSASSSPAAAFPVPRARSTKTPFYIGEVVKPDRHRKVPAVEVRFLDDNSLYWFPLAEVVEWAAAMKRRGSWRRFNPCSLADALAEGRGEEVKAAAAVLQSLTASGLTAGAGGGQQQAAACNSDGRRAGSVTPA